MKLAEEKFMAIIAVLAACFIAAHESSGNGAIALLGTYCYWLVRIGAEGLLFFGVRSTVENYASKSLSATMIMAISIVVSHLPFVLSVTAMDIVLGYPELGIGDSSTAANSRIAEFALELIYLFDNHIALCLLLSVPRWVEMRSAASSQIQTGSEKGTFLSAIEPSIDGEILWVAAQEHYVRITTQNENRMVLARFSDIVRELSNTEGLQVHRSHWVATSAIAKQHRKGQNLSLILTTGDVVPVSRSFKGNLAADEITES